MYRFLHPIPGHRCSNAFANAVCWCIAQEALDFGDICLAVAHISITKISVNGLACRNGLPCFARHDGLKVVAQQPKELIQGGAVAYGNVVDLI